MIIYVYFDFDMPHLAYWKQNIVIQVQEAFVSMWNDSARVRLMRVCMFNGYKPRDNDIWLELIITVLMTYCDGHPGSL